MTTLTDIPLGTLLGPEARAAYFVPGDHESLVARIENGLTDLTSQEAAEVLLLACWSADPDALPDGEIAPTCMRWSQQAYELCKDSDPNLALRAALLLFHYRWQEEVPPIWEELKSLLPLTRNPELALRAEHDPGHQALRYIEMAHVVVATEVSETIFRVVASVSLSKDEVMNLCTAAFRQSVQPWRSFVEQSCDEFEAKGRMTPVLQLRKQQLLEKLSQLEDVLMIMSAAV